MKGIAAFILVVGLTVGFGLWMQSGLLKTIEESTALLTEADSRCEDREYALSKAAAERFCRLWQQKEPELSHLYKYSLYREISEATYKLIPLLEERNLSEYRALCLETVFHLQMLRSYECLSLQGVL